MLTLDKFDIIKRPVRTNSTLGLWWRHDANLIGGILVGVGMALSGACPGTVLVQLAHGVSSAKATASGALLGATIFVKAQERHKESQCQIQKTPTAYKETISGALHVPEVAVYSLSSVAIAAVLGFTPAGNNRSPVLPVVGGLLIGCAQAVSLLLTHSPLGVSAAYEHFSRHLLNVLRGDFTAQTNLSPKPMIFSLGIVAGSVALLACNLELRISASDGNVPGWQAFVGGIAMIMGARLGGGCTSGHGLSGLSAMSASSLVTVIGMFGAGIMTRALMA